MSDIRRSEEIIDPGDDPVQDMLEHLGGGKPWVFIVADDDGDGIGLKVNCGGGIVSEEILLRLLKMTARAVDKEILLRLLKMAARAVDKESAEH